MFRLGVILRQLLSSFLWVAVLASPQAMPSRGFTWTLALGGDLMLNGISHKENPLEALGEVFRASDLSLVNLETPLTMATGRTTNKSVRDIARKEQFVLRAHPAHARFIAETGIRAVSLGNNHALDYGEAGVIEMTRALRDAGVAWCGAGVRLEEATRPLIISAGPMRRVSIVSYLAFRTTGGLAACTPAGVRRAGVAALDLGGQVNPSARERLRGIVAKARAGADFVIVALHWGYERRHLPSDYQVSLGRAFVDAGADLVVGHHPHVLQGAELYRGRPILYSLGNLVSPLPGETAIFVLTYQGSRFLSATVVPCVISGGKVRPAPDARGARILDALRGYSRSVNSKYPGKRLTPLPFTGVPEAR